MDSNLSSDKKYYGSGDVSALTGKRVAPPVTTKKVVRKNPSPGAESTDKYYANNAGQEVVDLSPNEVRRAETESISDVSDVGRIIDAVVDAFNVGATEVRVPAVEGLDTKARTNLDLRVGRGELTKSQADSVTFVILNPPPVEEAEPVAEEEQEWTPTEADWPDHDPTSYIKDDLEDAVEEEDAEEEDVVEEVAEEEEDGPSIASLFGADDDDDDGDD